MKAVVAAFNQEKALVGAFSVIVQPVVEPMDRFAALGRTHVSTPHQTNKSNQSRKLFAHFPNLIHYSGHAIVAPAGSNLDNIMRGEIGGSINTINSRTALRSTYHPSNSMGEAT